MKKFNLGIGIFLLGSASGLLLLLLRAMQVISFNEAHHVVTSGFEEESLFAMWKVLHNLPIYTDPHQIPFSASYFNWLFYGIYGSLITLVMNTFGLEDVWLPTVGRSITLLIVLMGFLVNYRLLVSPRINAQPLSCAIGASLSALLWFSPLIGFWAMTVRPDVVALLFDVSAIFFLLRYPRHSLKGIVLASICCYLSWACKQVNIVMPATIGLFLLYEKRYRAFIWFSVLLGLGYGITLLLANYNLLKTIFFINTAIPISMDVFWGNFTNFIKKSLPAVTLLGLVFFQGMYHKKVRNGLSENDMFKLGCCGLLAWAVILLPFSSKVGSADNYHFIALFFITLLAAGIIKQLLEQNANLTKPTGVAGILFVLSVGYCLSQGTLSRIHNQHVENIALKQCLEKLEQPIFVLNHYGALPWMNPSPISFVLAYNYWSDRINNRPFEHNGVGGLIKQGYFKTLVIPKDYTVSFDGASLSHYHQSQVCTHFAVMSKKENA